MNALVSPSRGVLIAFEDGVPVRALGIYEDEREVAPHVCAQIVAEIPDWEEITDIAPEDIDQKFIEVDEMADALSLFLTAVNPEMPMDLRRDAAVEVDELLKSERVNEYLQAVLFANTLPDKAVVSHLLEDHAHPLGGKALRAKAPRFVVFANTLLQLQPEVEVVCQSWESIPPGVFASASQERTARYTLMRAGCFAFAAYALAGSSFVGYPRAFPNEYEHIIDLWWSSILPSERAEDVPPGCIRHQAG
jgi:hypothetical protein